MRQIPKFCCPEKYPSLFLQLNPHNLQRILLAHKTRSKFLKKANPEFIAAEQNAKPDRWLFIEQ